VTWLPVVAVAGAFSAGPLRADDEAMLELAWDSGCFNCHDLRERIRGPAWADVAERYRATRKPSRRLVHTVINGGRGNWGMTS
jgi:cytochrome c